MRGDLAVQAAEFAQAARRAWVDACEKAARAAVVTRRAVRSGLLSALEPVETVLLSPSGRERVHATATFALIFLFAVSSVDFLITGGAEFGAPARAAPRQMVQAPPPNRDRAETRAVRNDEVLPTEIAAPLADATEASVTAVSQTFFAQLSQTPASAAIGGALVSLGGERNDASQPEDLPLIGETAEQDGAEPAPRKAEPRSPRRKAS